MTESRDTKQYELVEEERVPLARAFDTLVQSNIDMLRMLRASLVVFVVCGLIVTGVTICNFVMSRIGGNETRSLIRQLDRLKCEEKYR